MISDQNYFQVGFYFYLTVFLLDIVIYLKDILIHCVKVSGCVIAKYNAYAVNYITVN